MSFTDHDWETAAGDICRGCGESSLQVFSVCKGCLGTIRLLEEGGETLPVHTDSAMKAKRYWAEQGVISKESLQKSEAKHKEIVREVEKKTKGGGSKKKRAFIAGSLVRLEPVSLKKEALLYWLEQGVITREEYERRLSKPES